MTYRVGFLTSHPIQYQIPVFRLLSQIPGLDFIVYFCEIPDARTQGAGFDVSFKWDIPLLDGYQYKVLKNIARTPSVTAFFGCDTPEISHVIREGNFDAFIVNGWVVKSCLQALWACRHTGVPCLVRGEANDMRPRAWWKRVLQSYLVQQYSACLYIGEANKSFYQQRGVQSERLFRVPYCVDNDRFANGASTVTRTAARRRFCLRNDSTVFLFSGKLIPKKHPLELLTAVRSVVDRASQLELLIVGDGELRSECESFVQQNQLPVRFAGFLNQTEMADAYRASDCLVLPSDHGETWGLVVNEAMACGLPAIVSDQVGCNVDLVTPNETGRVFQFGDWNQLGEILVECSRVPGALSLMGENAYNRIARYSPAVAADGMWQAIQFACGN
ncbi:MAG: glycosyltransferase family 4 protein [Planctomycetes bacterium]|nr:glycosyltransferase family 4 protein [Planctomycetota bacterium]